MNEEMLKKLSFIISILGILVLFFITQQIQPKHVLSYSDLKAGDFITTSGKVVYSKLYQDFSIIRIENNITITCNCKASVNSTIKVMGRVIEYQNMLEIQAEEVTYDS